MLNKARSKITKSTYSQFATLSFSPHCADLGEQVDAMDSSQSNNFTIKDTFIGISDVLDNPWALLTIPEYPAVEERAVGRRRRRRQRRRTRSAADKKQTRTPGVVGGIHKLAVKK